MFHASVNVVLHTDYQNNQTQSKSNVYLLHLFVLLRARHVLQMIVSLQFQ